MALVELFLDMINPIRLTKFSLENAPAWMNIITGTGGAASLALMVLGISKTMSGYCDYPGVRGMFWGCNWMLLWGSRLFWIMCAWEAAVLVTAVVNRVGE